MAAIQMPTPVPPSPSAFMPYGTPATPPGQRLLRHALVVVRFVWPAALLIAVYACCCTWMWRYAEAQAGHYAVGPRAVELHLPDWMRHRHEDVQRIRMMGRHAEGLSLMDPKLPQTLAAAYAQSPWVESVQRIGRQFPNRLVVELTVRKPYATVRLGDSGQFVLVDRQGVRLPMPPTTKPSSDLPVVLVPGANTPKPGHPFGQRAITDAVNVIRHVRHLMPGVPATDALAVDGAEIGQWIRLGRDRRRVIVLYCRTPEGESTRLVWGVHFRPDEVPPYPLLTTEDKLDALQQQLALVAQSGRTAEYIDLSVTPCVHKLAPPQPLQMQDAEQ